MKVHVEAESQQEFEEKRTELLKALAGDRFEIIVKSAPKKAKFRAENEMLNHWDKRFKAMIAIMKKEVSAILDGELGKSTVSAGAEGDE
jgi:hypothetical protein